MRNKKNKAYNAEVTTDNKVLLTPLNKVQDNNFVKVSIVLTDREKYMQRALGKTRQGCMVLDYLLFDIDYNKDTIVIDRQALKNELGMSTRGIVRGIDNLIELGYISKTKIRGEYLINSDLFFKGIRTTKQKATATKTFNTYNDNRTINVIVKDTEQAEEVLKKLRNGFGIYSEDITDDTIDNDNSPLLIEGDTN